MFKRLLSGMLMLTLVVAMLVPAALTLAQDGGDDEEDDGFQVEIIAQVEVLDEEQIIIGGLVVAPAGAFRPSRLEVGDWVRLTGTMLNDTTLRAETLVVLDDVDEDGIPNEDDNCPQAPNPEQEDEDEDGVGDACPDDLVDADDADSQAADVDRDDDDDAADEDDEDADLDADEDEDEEICYREDHPVAMSFAREFDVEYETIMAWHCDDDMGFGDIAKVLILAELTGEDPAFYRGMRAAGMGWGRIAREAGVHPRDLAPGRVIGRSNN